MVNMSVQGGGATSNIKTECSETRCLKWNTKTDAKHAEVKMLLKVRCG